MELLDGKQVSSHTYYFLLEWNERNDKKFIAEAFGKQRLCDLTYNEYVLLFKYATWEEVKGFEEAAPITPERLEFYGFDDYSYGFDDGDVQESYDFRGEMFALQKQYNSETWKLLIKVSSGSHYEEMFEIKYIHELQGISLLKTGEILTQNSAAEKRK